MLLGPKDMFRLRYTTEVSPPTHERRFSPWPALATAACSISLVWAYAVLIAPSFGYLGYHWSTPDMGLLGLAVVELMVLSVFLPTHIEKPSDFMLWIIFTTVVLPVLMIGNVIGLLSTGALVGLAFWVGISFAIALYISRQGARLIEGRFPSLKPTSFWGAIAAFIVITIVLLVFINGVRTSLGGLLDVYEVRAAYKSNLGSFPLLAYLIPTVGYVAAPLIIVLGLHRRSWMITAVGVAAQLLVFSQTGYKTFLFGIPVIILLSAMIGRKVACVWIPAGLTVGVIGAGLADAVTNDIWFTSLYTRRFLATPGQLTANYIEYFGQHRHVMLSESILRGLVPYVWDMPIPFIMGEKVHGVLNNSSNVNFFGDGFAQGGWVGMVLAGVAFGVVLVLIDVASRGLPVSVPCMVMFLPCTVLANASILTALLSHGLAAGIVFLALAPRDSWSKSQPWQRPKNLILSEGFR